MPRYRLVCAISVILTALCINKAMALNYEYSVQGKDTITIGLLIDNAQNSQSAILAAQLAIEQANKGERNIVFRLASRITDGPWAQASKKAVELIYEEKAVVIVGALDGKTAHIAEQVATKSHIPYIETKATDPTLSKAFVPWFFQVVPTDYQISHALVEHIYLQNNFSRVAFVYDHTYDAEMAVSTLNSILQRNGNTSPSYLQIDNKKKPGQSDVMTDLVEGEFEAIVLISPLINKDQDLNKFLEQSGAKIYQYQFLAEQKTKPGYPYYTVSPIEDHAMYKTIFNELKINKGISPTIQSVYIFDAVNLIINTISESGSIPMTIGKYIRKQENFMGISGLIKFDSNGRLTRRIELIYVK